jgi:hypothetical protein
MASLFSKVAQFANSPKGKQAIQQATEKAQQLAKDPKTRAKIDGVRRGSRTCDRAASCSFPLEARACPPAGPGAPVRSVNRPPASRTITSSAAMSQIDTSGSQAMSTAPSASRQ